MSTAPTLLLDTGPWVALHCRDDTLHGGALEQFAHITGPLLACEAVVAETCFLLACGGHDPAKALALVACGVVRMSELYQRCRVFTRDADFHIHRHHGRKVIPLLSPA